MDSSRNTDVKDGFAVTEFLRIITAVYEEESEALLKAQNNPQHINYVVGKMMVKSKGQINPELAMKITKCIVESDLPNIRKIQINLSEIKKPVTNNKQHVCGNSYAVGNTGTVFVCMKEPNHKGKHSQRFRWPNKTKEVQK